MGNILIMYSNLKYMHDCYQAIHASQFQNLLDRTNTEFEGILNSLDEISAECKKIYGYVNSEDSELGEKWEQIGETIDKVEAVLRVGFESVGGELLDYCKQTIENEDALAKFVKGLDENLRSLVDSAENLVKGFFNLNDDNK